MSNPSQENLSSTPKDTLSPLPAPPDEYHGPSEEEKAVHPLDRVGFFSFFTFSWVNPIIKISQKHPWQQEYHYALSKSDRIEENESRLVENFRRTNSLLYSIFLGWKKDLAIVSILQIFSIIFQISNSVLLMAVMNELKSKTKKEDVGPNKGIEGQELLIIGGYFSAIIFANLTCAILDNHLNLIIQRLSTKVKTSLISFVMRKLLNFSVTNPSEFTEGKIMNFVGVDSNKFEWSCYQIVLFFKMLLNIIILVAILAIFTGYVSLVTFGTLVIGTTVLSVFNIWFWSIKRQLMAAKDSRMNMLKNAITNIRFVKLKALENFFQAKVFEKRSVETNLLAVQAWIIGLWALLNWTFPSICYVLVVYVIIEVYPEMDIVTIGPLIMILQLMEFAIRALPFSVQFFVDLKVS